MDNLPEHGAVVRAIVHNHSTGTNVEVVLRRVDEDDLDWRTADDGSELSYDCSVVSWRRI